MPKRDISGFIAHWSTASPSERANLQALLLEPCDPIEVPAPATPAELAKQFKRAKPENVAEILETLVTVGRAHRKGNQFTR